MQLSPVSLAQAFHVMAEYNWKPTPLLLAALWQAVEGEWTTAGSDWVSGSASGSSGSVSEASRDGPATGHADLEVLLRTSKTNTPPTSGRFDLPGMAAVLWSSVRLGRRPPDDRLVRSALLAAEQAAAFRFLTTTQPSGGAPRGRDRWLPPSRSSSSSWRQVIRPTDIARLLWASSFMGIPYHTSHTDGRESKDRQVRAREGAHTCDNTTKGFLLDIDHRLIMNLLCTGIRLSLML